MNSHDNGYIKLYRKIQFNPIWNKPPIYLKVWLYILQEVNHTNNTTKRGEHFFNYKELSGDCRVSYAGVDHIVRWLKSAMMIATRKTTRGVILTVLNYDDYQSSAMGSAKQLRNGDPTINKNDKNDKNKPNEVKTSKNSLTACSEDEIREIATSLDVSYEAVKRTHAIILNKIESHEFKGKTIYYSLKNWIMLGLERGTIKEKSSFSNYKFIPKKHESTAHS